MAILLRTLLLIFFVAAQSITLAHATEYGDAPHSHDGLPCAISHMPSHNGEELDVPPVFVLVVQRQLEAARIEFANTALIVPTVTASPPGRAPPFA